MKVVVLAVALACSLPASRGTQEPVSPDTAMKPVERAVVPGTLRFGFTPRSPEQHSWQITLQPDRSGWFQEQAPGAEEQAIHIGEATWKRLTAAEPALRSAHCETRQKGIAQTGMKTLSVATETGRIGCIFNYSDLETLNDASNEFLALAEMMQEGAKLQHDLRFDRLALDADMDGLLAEVAGGRATEPGNIAPVLQALVDNDRVIERVRRKAARLLQTPPATPAGSASPAVEQRLKPR